MTDRFVIPLTKAMVPHAETAITRLGYLYPTLQFAIANDGIEIAGNSEQPTDHLRREVMYAVYREKILADTLPLRSALLAAVTES